MSRIRTFLIGRHPDCDLNLDDSSVSRYHAEVVLVPDGSYYIIDRNSTGGTFVYNNSRWHGIRQATVSSGEQLRFGNHEIPASHLECLRAIQSGAGGDVTGAVHGSGSVVTKPDDGLDPDKGLIRNPDTGEIVEQS